MNYKLNIIVDPNFFKKYIYTIGENEYKFKLQDDGLHTFMKNQKGDSKLFIDWDAKYVDLTIYNKRPFSIDLQNGDGLEKIDTLEKLYVFVNLAIECIERIYLLGHSHRAIKSAKKLKYFIDMINFTKYIPKQYILSSYFSGSTNLNVSTRINFTYTSISSTIILNIQMGNITLFFDWENKKMVFDFDVDSLTCDELINLYLDKCSRDSGHGPDGRDGSSSFYPYGPDSKSRKKFKFVLYLDREDSEYEIIMIHYKSIIQFLITETMSRLLDIETEKSKNALLVLRFYVSSDRYLDFLVGNIKKTKNQIAFVEEVPLNYNQLLSTMHNGSIVDVDYEKGFIKYSYQGQHPVILNMDTGDGLKAILSENKLVTFIELINKIIIQQSGTNNHMLKKRLNNFMNIMTHFIQKEKKQESTFYVPQNESTFFVPKNESTYYVPKNESTYYVPKNESTYYVPKNESTFFVPNGEVPFDMLSSEIPFVVPNKETFYESPIY